MSHGELLTTLRCAFQWGKDPDSGFKDLKHVQTHAPLLTFPNFKDPFFIQAEANMSGIGAVLMQMDEAGKRHAIAFARRVLQPAEKNYSVTHADILAVVWALQHFRNIIMGYKITVYTDLTAITEIFKDRIFSVQLARWYLTTLTYTTLKLNTCQGNRMWLLTHCRGIFR